MKTKKIECDEPMARSKGLKDTKKAKSLGRCTGECSTCIAGIKTTKAGDRAHN